MSLKISHYKWRQSWKGSQSSTPRETTLLHKKNSLPILPFVQKTFGQPQGKDIIYFYIQIIIWKLHGYNDPK